MKRVSLELAVGIALAFSGAVLVAVLAVTLTSAALDPGRSSTPPANPGASTVADASPAATDATGQISVAPSVTSKGTGTPVAPPTPAPTPILTPAASPETSPPLPALLAAIGDSYTQAWSVSPAYKRDHPGYSWAVGTVKGDGVFSLLERFQALGDKPEVVDAATSGKKMSDAARQATAIVAQASRLPPGATAYVTFELGTNDLCDDPPTDPAAFESQLRSAVSILRSGLPDGSRILMLPVPDFSHFHDITQADPNANAALQLTVNSRNCAPYLGWDSPLSLQAAEQVRSGYDVILDRVCDEIEATDGKAGRLHCRRNETLLAESDFTIKDLSTVDYFHPSLSGQARMAEAAWKASYWADVALPSGAAFAPGGSGAPVLQSMAWLAPILPGSQQWRRGRRSPR